MRAHRVPSEFALAAPSGLRLPTGLIILVGDVLALALAFAASTFITDMFQTRLLHRYPGEFYSPYLHDRIIALFFLSALLIGGFSREKHYTSRRAFWTELKHILVGVGFVMVVDGWLQFAMKVQVSRLWHIHLWVYAATFLICSRVAVRKALMNLGLWQRATVVIGKQGQIEEFRTFATREPYLGYEVEATVAIEQGSHITLKRLNDHLAVKPQIAYAVIASEGMSASLLSNVIDVIERRHIRYGVIPPLKGVPLLGFQVEDFFGSDFIVLQNHRMSLEDPGIRLAKRCFDVMAASVLLTLLSPVMLILACLIRLDGGPALYRSQRIGYGNSTFSALKFRTMRTDAAELLSRLLAEDPQLKAEWQADFKLRRDPRVTRLGRFMRRTSLDELPQLINVLRGEMSLVGPRPILPEEIVKYKPWIHLYTRMLPGITGMWQVSGRNSIEYQRRIQLNNWYAHNWSFWHDAVILIRTVMVVLSRKGAE
jgi:Undecaprenyl-phosphate galactose phosphotransferase WbaP